MFADIFEVKYGLSLLDVLY